MKSIRGVFFGLGVVTCLVLGGAIGQEKGDKTEKTKKEEPNVKARGQLPQYWGQLGLTDTQKQDVYKVQAKYNEQIEKLEAKIAELKSSMTSDRSKILTTEQKKRLEEIIKTKAGTDK
jgi:flagellar motility protein MotE (MotC chaperone)